MSSQELEKVRAILLSGMLVLGVGMAVKVIVLVSELLR